MSDEKKTRDQLLQNSRHEHGRTSQDASATPPVDGECNFDLGHGWRCSAPAGHEGALHGGRAPAKLVNPQEEYGGYWPFDLKRWHAEHGLDDFDRALPAEQVGPVEPPDPVLEIIRNAPVVPPLNARELAATEAYEKSRVDRALAAAPTDTNPETDEEVLAIAKAKAQRIVSDEDVGQVVRDVGGIGEPFGAWKMVDPHWRRVYAKAGRHVVDVLVERLLANMKVLGITAPDFGALQSYLVTEDRKAEAQKSADLADAVRRGQMARSLGIENPDEAKWSQIQNRAEELWVREWDAAATRNSDDLAEKYRTKSRVYGAVANEYRKVLQSFADRGEALAHAALAWRYSESYGVPPKDLKKFEEAETECLAVMSSKPGAWVEVSKLRDVPARMAAARSFKATQDGPHSSVERARDAVDAAIAVALGRIADPWADLRKLDAALGRDTAEPGSKAAPWKPEQWNEYDPLQGRRRIEALEYAVHLLARAGGK